MILRRSGWKSLAFFVLGSGILGFGTLALAASGDLLASEVDRPLAVDPASEAPSSAFVELQKHAIAQPSGKLSVSETPVVPQIASPNR
jgi:hypothetical protein